ncbi:MAG TPA: hypothetical protein VJ529_01215 [Candidatus Bathyarchaeia archaeon]|nr:hypothetical protein [Candidatus Bathyarchaeia archaeon]
MEETSSNDELKPRLTTLFCSVSATVFDALILYFVLVLSGGPIDAAGVLVTIMAVGLLLPCLAGILVSLFWERKNIFVYSMMLYGLIVFAGSVYYTYMLSSVDIWGILFALIGVVVTYLATRHVRQSHSE